MSFKIYFTTCTYEEEVVFLFSTTLQHGTKRYYCYGNDNAMFKGRLAYDTSTARHDDSRRWLHKTELVHLDDLVNSIVMESRLAS
jgi:hypothetical protein